MASDGNVTAADTSSADEIETPIEEEEPELKVRASVLSNFF